MKKLRLTTRRLSLESSTILAVLVIAVGLLTFRLRKLLPGMASGEQVLPTVHDTLQTIWNVPFELPIHLSRLFVAVILPTGGITASRLPSVLLALVMAVGMYWLLRRWYGYRLALFGTALLITASWFLHDGRLATSSIVYPLCMTAVLIMAALWHNPRRIKTLLYLSAVIGAITLYVPGMMWLMLGVVIIERRNFLRVIKENKKQASLALAAYLALLIPMAHALFLHWQSVRIVAGLPKVDTLNALTVLEQAGRAWQYIFLGGYNNPLYNVGGLALLSVTVSVLFGVGVYLHSLHPESARTHVHAYLWLVGTVVIALGVASVSLILPIVVVLATGGVGYLLHLWLKVFPRNPLARGFGIGLLVIMITFAVAYDLRNYFVAWPGSPVTKAAFQRLP